MRKKSIFHPHDKFFKEAFSHRSIAMSFIVEYLCSGEYEFIKSDTMKSIQDDHTTKNLKESLSDSVYCALNHTEDKWVYFVFEHKSYIDHDVGIQLLNNLVTVSQYHNLQQKNDEHRSPIILSVLVYLGQYESNPLSQELIEFRFPKQLNNFFPDLRLLFFDFSHQPNEAIKGNPFLRILFLTLKMIHNPDFINIIPEIIVLFKEQIDDPDVLGFFTAFVTYIEAAAPQDSIDKIVTIIENGLIKEDCMTSKLLQQIANDVLFRKGKIEGIQEGIQEGKQEGRDQTKVDIAIKMISAGMDSTTIAHFTGLEIEDIDKLRT